MFTATRRSAMTLALASLGAAGLLLGALASASSAAVTHHASHLHVVQILNGKNLSHSFVAGGQTQTEALSGPDDITVLDGHLVTAFQNGVGAQGEPSKSGNTDSTVVEFSPSGHVISQWDVTGKVDGVTADPRLHALVATVNEDGNSSIYLIVPKAPAPKQIQHFSYNKPLPHNGGTDAISIFHGQVIVSASAPGTTGGMPAPQPNYPALYLVRFHRSTGVATVTSLFSDEAPATVANVGQRKTVNLALTDPDSNEVVPHSAARFRGDFMLSSQGDLQQIFVLGHRGSAHQHAAHFRTRLAVLNLSQSIDDAAWATSRFGRLYTTDSTNDAVDVITGRFPVGVEFAAVTPCNANSAPSTCPAPGFPPNYLGVVNQFTGQVSAVTVSGPTFFPKGLVFVRSHAR